jgi:hypothetical protein
MTKLHSKSYKQIYMEWIHDKSLCNQRLKEKVTWTRRHKCRFVLPRPSSLRSTDQYDFQSIGGFTHHEICKNKLLFLTFKR